MSLVLQGLAWNIRNNWHLKTIKYQPHHNEQPIHAYDKSCLPSETRSKVYDIKIITQHWITQFTCQQTTENNKLTTRPQKTFRCLINIKHGRPTFSGNRPQPNCRLVGGGGDGAYNSLAAAAWVTLT
jgi:hypothetical protein